MDKGQGFTSLYVSFYLAISVDVPVTFNQTRDKNGTGHEDPCEAPPIILKKNQDTNNN